VKHRFAEAADVPLLAQMNLRLTEDEDHPNRSRPPAWFEERMRGFLAGAYRAILFEQEGTVVGYALYIGQTDPAGGIYLRQLYVEREYRRQGLGREMMRILREEIWRKGERITLSVLSGNESAIAFYRALGFRIYSVEMEIPEN
jgi:ribosomal protein S18 acetylase RimI-like enzyme